MYTVYHSTVHKRGMILTDCRFKQFLFFQRSKFDPAILGLEFLPKQFKLTLSRGQNSLGFRNLNWQKDAVRSRSRCDN